VIHARSIKIAVASAGLVLAGGVAAAAAGSPPEAADHGISTAEEHTGIELPATKDSHPTKDDHPGGGPADQAPDDVVVEAEAEGQGPVDNHGADVSAVAKDDSTEGREHGEAVSEVARDNHGQSGEQGPPEGAGDTGAEHRAPQAELGAGNAGEHGKP
jgi:hypothetical protein